MTIQRINSRAALAAFAREHGLRPDWHEPDEQYIDARIIGTHLDNAMGPRIEPLSGDPENIHGEFNIVLTQEDGPVVSDVAVVNLATLLSWAAQTEDPPAIDRAQVSAFMKRILPAIHEPLLTQVADEWADKFMTEFGL